MASDETRPRVISLYKHKNGDAIAGLREAADHIERDGRPVAGFVVTVANVGSGYEVGIDPGGLVFFEGEIEVTPAELREIARKAEEVAGGGDENG